LGDGEQVLQKALAEALPTFGWGYDYVFQLPIGGDVLGYQERQYAGRRIGSQGAVNHKNQSFRALGLEGLAVLVFRPVAGRGGLALQEHHGSYVGESGGTDLHDALGEFLV
jgi:hypothetical protein